MKIDEIREALSKCALQEEPWNLPHDLALEMAPEAPHGMSPLPLVFFEIQIPTATLSNEESLMGFEAQKASFSLAVSLKKVI